MSSPDSSAHKTHAQSDSGNATSSQLPGNPSTTGWVVFLVMGPSLHPEQISAELGLDPDRVAYADPAADFPGIWQLNSALAGDEPLEAHFWNLLDRLAPVYREVAALSKQYRLEFFCSIHKTTPDMEPVALSPRLLLLMGHIGAHLEFEASDSDEHGAEAEPAIPTRPQTPPPIPSDQSEAELTARIGELTRDLKGNAPGEPAS